jgi:fucose permease
MSKICLHISAHTTPSSISCLMCIGSGSDLFFDFFLWPVLQKLENRMLWKLQKVFDITNCDCTESKFWLLGQFCKLLSFPILISSLTEGLILVHTQYPSNVLWAKFTCVFYASVKLFVEIQQLDT